MIQLLGLFLSAFATENLYFVRAFDAYSPKGRRPSAKELLRLGLVCTLTLLLTGPLAFLLGRLLQKLSVIQNLTGLVLLLLLIGCYAAFYWLLKLGQPWLFRQVKEQLPYAVLNCATLGSLLLVAKDSQIDSLGEVLAYHLGAGLGFCGGLLLFYSLRQRLMDCRGPRSFRGLPLQLVTLGLIALALVGLSGNQLPA